MRIQYIITLCIVVSCCPAELDIPECGTDYRYSLSEQDCICDGIELPREICLSKGDSTFQLVRVDGWSECWRDLEAVTIRDDWQEDRFFLGVWTADGTDFFQPFNYLVPRDFMQGGIDSNSVHFPTYFDCYSEEHEIDRLAVTSTLRFSDTLVTWRMDYYDADGEIDLGVFTELHFQKLL